ncbi:hypothetical protein ACFIQF_01675 [Comamonas sp. J-3]
MKIPCRCGSLIVDGTDYLPNKAHLTPDQGWFNVFDTIDSAIIDSIFSGKLSKDDAYMHARKIVQTPTRTMWQCGSCGRLFIDSQDGSLQCFSPEDPEKGKNILALRNSV